MGKKFLKYGILAALAAAVCFIAYSSCNKPVGERIYQAAVCAVEQSSRYPAPVFADYDEKYLTMAGRGVYRVEVHIKTTNVYQMEKKYVYDVTVRRVEDGSFVAENCRLRVGEQSE